MERTQPHACGSPAPALTLGPKRTWRNGRRSRLQLECPRGNPRRRTAQIRGTLQAERPKPIPSQARLQAARDGVETRRGAPKAKRPRRRDSPDHERPFFQRAAAKAEAARKSASRKGVRVRVPPSAPGGASGNVMAQTMGNCSKRWPQERKRWHSHIADRHAPNIDHAQASS